MKRNHFPFLLLLLLPALAFLPATMGLADPPPAAGAARVVAVSPTGTSLQVRQATARFSEPIVEFGDPRAIDPFSAECDEPGQGHWADPRNWVYEFARDLPGDLRCRFVLRAGLRTLSGAAVAPMAFSFDTGGPTVVKAFPVDGDEDIDERQAFVLGLSAPADAASLRAHVWCAVDGIQERVPVEAIVGRERAELLDRQKSFAREFFQALGKNGARGILALKDDVLARLPLATLRCARPLPSGRKVKLVWGAGVTGPHGLATRQDQALAFAVRKEFRATLDCTRVDPKGNCVPVAPLQLNFSAPVPRASAAAIRLRGGDGKVRLPVLDSSAETQERVSFAAPLPEASDVQVVLPDAFKDDAGRSLANQADFPLRVHLDAAPPLIKFGASFGILEAHADPVLPVSVRNVESRLDARQSALPPRPAVHGQLARLDASDDQAIADWYYAVTQGVRRVAHRAPRSRKTDAGADAAEDSDAEDDPSGRNRPEGTMPLLHGQEAGFDSTPLDLPAARGDHALELLGIPLPAPGLYLVEFASPRLGAALLDKPQPYYAHAGALVTNLAIHFKLGAQSSLAWVTRLDNAQPVGGAEVHVADCLGKVQWTGHTDAQGIARIEQELPREHDLWRACPGYGTAKLVTARTADDLAFLLSSWNDGILPWQFNIRQFAGAGMDPDGHVLAHTVTDRPLFRAGETVSMKHFLRVKSAAGLDLPTADSLPTEVELHHLGSEQSYHLPLHWNDGQALSTWQIPAEARLGTYGVRLRRGQRSWESGTFRVEQFRVPLMKAVLKPPAHPQVRPEGVDIDAQLSFLSGGPAGDTAVKVRSQLLPQAPEYADYPDYEFSGSLPKEGISAETPDFEYDASGEDSDAMPEEGAQAAPAGRVLATQALVLDHQGGRRIRIGHLPPIDTPQNLQVEMEYLDPNGAILNAATSVRLLPSGVVLGIRTGAGYGSQDALAFRVVALDAEGHPRARQAVTVDAYTSTTFAYRKRLLGGFYSFEQSREVHRAGRICSGRTDEHGLLLCEGHAPAKGELVLVAQSQDADGHAAVASASYYVAGADDWFATGSSDRIDLLADRLSYEPGQTAHVQVRMPFRDATALVAVEREGVLATQVVHLQGKAPVVDVPILARYGPNTFVSVLAVRGRIDPEQPGVFAWLRYLVQRLGHWLGLADAPAPLLDTRPTALVDLARPAFRLGMIPVRVGWQGYSLKVNVETDRDSYRVRDHVHARISVTDSQGRPAAHTSVALAAVDEGLLALAPATSWQLLDAMMAPRNLEVETSTAQSQVVGKRHFGKKAVPAGGGGGAANARELFDTLLAWQPDLHLDANGKAEADIVLNDSLTSFRLEAIAAQGAAQFGSGGSVVHTTQDVMLFAGLAPLVREGDQYNTLVTVRNASQAPLAVDVHADTRAGANRGDAGTQTLRLDAGQAGIATFASQAPVGVDHIDWSFDAQVRGTQGAGTSDHLKLAQQVVPALPVRTLERTLTQLMPGQALQLPVKSPADAVAGRGGVEVRLSASLGGDLQALRDWFAAYPFDCIEQQASRAVADRSAGEWEALMRKLPTYLDGDGLVRYFPSPFLQGDDTLTSYLLVIANEAGLVIPQAERDRMLSGLRNFLAGRVQRYGRLPSADLMLRRLTALEALARYGQVQATELATLDLAPERWPSSALLDWISLLQRLPDLPDRDARLDQARSLLRARLTWSGTRLAFSTEKSDALWWLMVSPDLNAVRALRLLGDDPSFRDDLPRLARGALERQRHGHWATTTANAWGVLALERFHRQYERDTVAGTTRVQLAGIALSLPWAAAGTAAGTPPGQPAASSPGAFQQGQGTSPGIGTHLPWPAAAGTLELAHEGSGRPWAFVSATAAVPLAQPLFAGLRLERKITPVEQKTSGQWTRGDVYEVSLTLETQADETWVALEDPVPAGGTILGSGLGGDSAQLAAQDTPPGLFLPAFVERKASGCLAYWSWLPKGKHLFRYRVRLNASGRFQLPDTHAEVMYSPEVMASLPLGAMTVVEP